MPSQELAYALREAVVDAARRLIWLPEAQTTLPGDGETWSAVGDPGTSD